VILHEAISVSVRRSNMTIIEFDPLINKGLTYIFLTFAVRFPSYYRLRIINGQIERQSPQLFLHTLQDDQTDSEHA